MTLFWAPEEDLNHDTQPKNLLCLSGIVAT